MPLDIPHLQHRYQHLAKDPVIINTDVFIAGSGPIGCAFARTIIDKTAAIEKLKNTKVFMSEVGSHSSPRLGWHHKNELGYQKDIDRFVHVIKGALSTLSVPTVDTYQPLLQPTPSWTPDEANQLIMSGNNPLQDPFQNLGASAVTRTVGGMATHWTCATPNPHAEELPDTFTSSKWDALYARAKTLVKTNLTAFDNSIRHNVVKDTLNDAYKNDPGRVFKNLPLAVERRTDNPEYVTWTGSDTVLGDLAVPGKNPRFTLKAETRATAFVHLGNKIHGVLLRDLSIDQDFVVIAKAYVAACGAILTPQLLHNSGIRPVALGRYLTEQSMTFCQIALKRSIIADIETNPKYAEKVAHHHQVAPKDPLPIPFRDPEPQVTQPYHHDRPWHTQIHRDAFSYGDVGPSVDPRLVVDLRWFGYTEVNPENRVEFPPYIPGDGDNAGVSGLDSYGMPQPTFYFRHSPADQERNHRMMADMCDVASHLGGYIPGSNPQFMTPGLALHIMGTIRAGTDKNTSVVDKNSKVHDIDNLWLGGNGVIPTALACNPTLTSICYALQAADSIVEFLGTA